MDNPVVTDWLTRPEGLATKLRAARVEAAISIAALGREAGWSHAKVSRIEHGHTMPSADDIEQWADICSINKTTTKRLLAELKETKSLHLQLRSGLDQVEHQRSYDELLANATTISMYETSTIPGPLQIPAYAQGVLEVWSRFLDFDSDGLDEAAATRAAQSQHLYDLDTSFRFIIDETALHWRPCDKATMRAQLDRLLTASELANVEIGIIRLSGAVATTPPLHNFGIYDDTVYVETWTGELIHSEPAIVKQYQKTLDLLTDASSTDADARKLIVDALEFL